MNSGAYLGRERGKEKDRPDLSRRLHIPPAVASGRRDATRGVKAGAITGARCPLARLGGGPTNDCGVVDISRPVRRRRRGPGVVLVIWRLLHRRAQVLEQRPRRRILPPTQEVSLSRLLEQLSSVELRRDQTRLIRGAGGGRRHAEQIHVRAALIRLPGARCADGRGGQLTLRGGRRQLESRRQRRLAAGVGRGRRWPTEGGSPTAVRMGG